MNKLEKDIRQDYGKILTEEQIADVIKKLENYNKSNVKE